MHVRLNKCDRELLIIRAVNPSRNCTSYNYDLGDEINELTTKLQQNDLLNNRDYTVDFGPYPNTSPEYNIQFVGASRVIRALNVLANKDNNYKFDLTSTDQLTPTLIAFSLQISTRECTEHDKPIKENSQNRLFIYLTTEIEKVNNKFNKPSDAMNQLANDWNIIKNHPNDLWGKCNFYLAYAALQHAKTTAKNQENSQKKITLFGGDKKSSESLSENYQKILTALAGYLSYIPGYVPNQSEEKKFDFLEPHYYKVVETLQPNSNAAKMQINNNSKKY